MDFRCQFQSLFTSVDRVPGFPGTGRSFAGSRVLLAASITRSAEAVACLGYFLRELHQPAPIDAPKNRFRGVPLSDRAGTVDDRFVELADQIDVPVVRKVWERAMAAPRWFGPPRWVHGDLRPANLVVDGGTVVGVLDFGDLTAGDPATDLAAFWMLFPYSEFATFSRVYGGIDRDLELRSLGWAVLFGLMLLSIGLDVSQPERSSYAVVDAQRSIGSWNVSDGSADLR